MVSTYNCLVMSFDPSMPVGDHIRGTNIHFYQLGIGPANTVNKDGWRLQTLGSILSQAGHLHHTIDVLKIDIEFNEWPCFKTMIKEGTLKRVKQLLFELHTPEVLARPSRVTDFSMIYSILHHIEDLGFRRFRYHANPTG